MDTIVECLPYMLDVGLLGSFILVIWGVLGLQVRCPALAARPHRAMPQLARSIPRPSPPSSLGLQLFKGAMLFRCYDDIGVVSGAPPSTRSSHRVLARLLA